MIHISLGEGGAEDVNTYGAETVTGSVDLVSHSVHPSSPIVYTVLMTIQAQIEWDPYTYTGDIAIRKFPYDRQSTVPALFTFRC